jgi:hypothetical protein
VFFVATAAPEAHVNVSPRGLDTFRVRDPCPPQGDGRTILMFCAFEGYWSPVTTDSRSYATVSRTFQESVRSSTCP